MSVRKVFKIARLSMVTIYITENASTPNMRKERHTISVVKPPHTKFLQIPALKVTKTYFVKGECYPIKDGNEEQGPVCKANT